MLLLNSSANRSDFFHTHRRLHSLTHRTAWSIAPVRQSRCPMLQKCTRPNDPYNAQGTRFPERGFGGVVGVMPIADLRRGERGKCASRTDKHLTARLYSL